MDPERRQEPPAPLLDVVIVNYRQRALTLECLRSVAAALDSAAGAIEVTVVDNGSADGSAAAVAGAHPWAEVIELPVNVGFPGGVNAGLQRARGEWVLLLNNDTTVMPDAFERLEAAISTADADVGAIAAQMRFAHAPETVNSAGIGVDTIGVARDLCLGEPITGAAREPREVFGASGGAAAYRRRVLDGIGGYDESFFVYLEDVDVAWRARLAGWRTLYDPTVVVLHHHAATSRHRSPFKNFHVGRNRVRVVARNLDWRTLLRHLPELLTYDIAYCAFVAAVDHDLSPVRGRWRGLREWRQYRRSGATMRRRIALEPSRGPLAALGRRSAWPVAAEDG